MEEDGIKVNILLSSCLGLIEFLKALEVFLLAAVAEGSKQRIRACGELFSLCDFLLTPGDGMKYARGSGMGI